MSDASTPARHASRRPSEGGGGSGTATAQPQQSEECRHECIGFAGEQADMVTGRHAAPGQRAGPSSHLLTELVAGK
jgi:hypothetical protein